MLSFSISYPDLLKLPYFADLTQRRDSEWKEAQRQGEDRKTPASKEADARDPNLRGLSRCSPLVPLALVAGSLGLSLWAHHSPLWRSLIRHWRCEASGNGARISRGSAPRGAMYLSSSPLPGCVRRLFVVFDPLPQSLWHPPFATLHNPNRRFSG